MAKKTPKKKNNAAADILDAFNAASAKWTRQRKSEERHPGNIRYRVSRLTKEPQTTQKEAAWQHMEAAYMRASGGGSLPASARQIYYQIRPKVMEMTDDKELQYGYFSQTLLPNYIEEHGVAWNVVYDARGHFTEPHTNRAIDCGTIEVNNYLYRVKKPQVEEADFDDASVKVIGPDGGFNKIMYCEKEGFGPLWRAVNLANRWDVLIISNKGQSVTAARKLIDVLCGGYGLPLFVLHDFDVAGFAIRAVFERDTRRYRFMSAVRVIDLGLRLEDIDGLGSEPAAATKMSEEALREQLANDGATGDEAAFLVTERVELNALTSDALVALVESGFRASGTPRKAMPDDDALAEAYRAFHRSQALREKFDEVVKEFDEEAEEVEVPKDLRELTLAVLAEHDDLRWDDAIQTVLDPDELDRVREKKREAKKKSGDFTGTGDFEEGEGEPTP
jgi:hypothetical protein